MIKLAIQVIVLIDYVIMAIAWIAIPICDVLEEYFDVRFSEKFISVHVKILTFSTILFVITLIAPLR